MKTNKIFSLALLFLAFATIYSCKTIPENATAVKPFCKEKYLGKWYEIARIDFKFEKDLNNTTAEYSLKKDGKIKVDNKGYNVKNTNGRKQSEMLNLSDMKILQCLKYLSLVLSTLDIM